MLTIPNTIDMDTDMDIMEDMKGTMVEPTVMWVLLITVIITKNPFKDREQLIRGNGKELQWYFALVTF